MEFKASLDSGQLDGICSCGLEMTAPARDFARVGATLVLLHELGTTELLAHNEYVVVGKTRPLCFIEPEVEAIELDAKQVVAGFAYLGAIDARVGAHHRRRARAV